MASVSLFGAQNLELTPKIISFVLSMASPDRPVDSTLLLGDFAFSEICVSDKEVRDIKETIGALRSDDQKEFVGDFLDALEAKGKESNNQALIKLASAVETEYKKLLTVFFPRARAFLVYRNSTEEVVGRFVLFPDQISDDYGNNLDEHSEQSMNTMKVVNGNVELPQGRTVYVGHGQGATMALFLASLKDEAAIIFDPTLLSEVVVRSALRNELPPKVKPAKRQEGSEEACKVVYYFLRQLLTPNEKTYNVARELLRSCAEKQVEQVKQKKEEEKEKAKKQPKQQGANKKDKKEEEAVDMFEEGPKYFANSACFMEQGLIRSDVQDRMDKTGRFHASSLSDLFMDPMTSIKPADAYPFESEPATAEAEQEAPAAETAPAKGKAKAK